MFVLLEKHLASINFGTSDVCPGLQQQQKQLILLEVLLFCLTDCSNKHTGICVVWAKNGDKVFK